MTRSVEGRFLSIVATTIFILVVPLFGLFLYLASESASRELQQNLDVLLAANAQALAKPLWDFDRESVEQISATIVSSDKVERVQVADASGGIQVSMPPQHKWPGGRIETLTRDIIYEALDGPKQVGKITIHYKPIDLLSSLRRSEAILTGIFAMAVIGLVAAAVIGNRLMVIKPLLRLTGAIEATRRLGSRHHVDWESNDEIGRLARSFNAMQSQLEKEERELKHAHRRATDIYNLTPAMLFSLDDEDQITGVSDYWLVATGYARSDVIGRRFSDLVPDESRSAYLDQKLARNTLGVVELTTRFVCADGEIMDILIAEAGKLEYTGKNGLSLSVMTDVTALKRSEERNLRQAITDHLTGLMNRQGFESALDTQIRTADASDGELACLFIDLDRFKWINDNLGHEIGDAVLCRFVEHLRPHLTPDMTAARLGGDEFAIILRTADRGAAEKAAVELGETICSFFVEPMSVRGATVRLSASIGIALYPEHATSAAELLQKSDMAMYRKKRDGKNGAQVYHPSFEDGTRERAAIEHDIELGLSNDWFDAYFQPIIQMKTGRIVGYEALLRLLHPERGVIPPGRLISIAEETGAIDRVGTRMLEKALENFVRLSEASGNSDTYLAINLSPLQFEPALPMKLTAMTNRYGIAPGRIVIEITEATLLHDNPQIRTILDSFNRHGYRIALDDFGTGYSSLSYLNRFPVDIVKIDQSFVRAMCDDETELNEKSRMLVEGITAISHKMACTVVAEGIETEEQWALLKSFGVDNGQGYLFARPQSVATLIAEQRAKPEPRQRSVA
ncbi:EAL domain-containing protein [Peteryoungia desertarenae]|uniref:EAL domain-containing protein n=1 Tax=Peteryoungia desertarenae TaxID=1813451 RepID=A0ABX6QR41_9HYPH|nr:EAL domain-containing protein [Peteryoungia desertarenae]QLF70963.1 EAL domain-containing protein [Peteryoungia desertarenae]